MSISSFIQDFIRGRGGNVAITAALAMPMVVGGAAFGVDSLYWYVRDLQLQAAADAAAYGAALEMRAGREEPAVKAAAGREAGDNGFDAANGTITVNTPPTEGDFQRPQAVEVVLTQRQDRFFSSLFDDSAVQAKVRAVAIYNTSSEACVIALDPGAPASVSMSGSSALKLEGCSVVANSISDSAVDLRGGSQLETPCLISGGGVKANASVSLTECADFITRAPPVADPFRLVPKPAPAGGCRNDSGPVLQPGRYCNGLNLRGSVQLQPGVYYVEGGSFQANANANAIGEGVTIFLADGVGTRFNGTANLNLSAPTSGPYSGLLFFADRNGGRRSHVFNGGAGSSLTGAIYMASQDIEYAGNFAGADGCLQIVARTVSWSGKANIAADCTSRGMAALPGQQQVRIVE